MDYRQTLLVLLAVLLCSSQGLTESSTEASLVQTPPDTSTKAITKSTPQDNVSDLLKMMNILNRRILEVTKTDYEMNTRIMTRLDEMNSESVKRFEEINSTMMTRLDEMNSESVKRFEEINSTMMTRLDEMNSESVKRFEEINSTMMTRLDEMNSESVKRFEEINSTMMTRLDEMNSESVKRFDENNSTMFSLFDKLDKKTQKNSDESLKKSEEMDNKLMKRLDEMNAETVNRFNEMDLRVKYLEVSTIRKEKQFVLFTNERKTWQGAYDDCIKRNMMLASIESEEENNKVRSLFKNSDKYGFWLSGSDLGHTGRYVWKSTGRDVTYNQWGPREPNHYVHSDGEVQHCVYVWRDNMRWYDERCSSHLHYICQH